MTSSSLGILHLSEQFVERIWGGRRLAHLFGKPLPLGVRVGEAWLVSDHPSAPSVILSGPYAGATLHTLLLERGEELLGTCARPTPRGLFPLLLKLLDADDVLSVQVHPNDEQAESLGETDVGKTEMWYVMFAEKNASLYCGLQPNLDADGLREAVARGSLDRDLVSHKVVEGDAIMVPAGTVHAIGAGLVLAEIQQNSDVTYRLYDWGRLQADGTPRPLHVDKAAKVICYGAPVPRLSKGLVRDNEPAERVLLGASPYFAAERVRLENQTVQVKTFRRSFHIILGVNGCLDVCDDKEQVILRPGQTVLVPAASESYTLGGGGTALLYYVPDLRRDVLEPFIEKGLTEREICDALGVSQGCWR